MVLLPHSPIPFGAHRAHVLLPRKALTPFRAREADPKDVALGHGVVAVGWWSQLVVVEVHSNPSSSVILEVSSGTADNQWTTTSSETTQVLEKRPRKTLPQRGGWKQRLRASTCP